MFEKIIGQKKTCNLIEIAILAARKRDEVVDSFLFYSADQYTRHQIASAIVSELGVKCREVRREQIRNKTPGEWGADLNNCCEGDCFIIEGIDSVSTEILEDILIPAIKEFRLSITIGKGYSARSIDLDLPHICFIILAEKLDEVPNQIVNEVTNIFRLDNVNEITRALWFKECLEQKQIQIDKAAIEEFSKLELSHMRISKIVNNLEAYSVVNKGTVIPEKIVKEVMEDVKKELLDSL